MPRSIQKYVNATERVRYVGPLPKIQPNNLHQQCRTREVLTNVRYNDQTEIKRFNKTKKGEKSKIEQIKQQGSLQPSIYCPPPRALRCEMGPTQIEYKTNKTVNRKSHYFQNDKTHRDTVTYNNNCFERKPELIKKYGGAQPHIRHLQHRATTTLPTAKFRDDLCDRSPVQTNKRLFKDTKSGDGKSQALNNDKTHTHTVRNEVNYMYKKTAIAQIKPKDRLPPITNQQRRPIFAPVKKVKSTGAPIERVYEQYTQAELETYKPRTENRKIQHSSSEFVQCRLRNVTRTKLPEVMQHDTEQCKNFKLKTDATDKELIVRIESSSEAVDNKVFDRTQNNFCNGQVPGRRPVPSPELQSDSCDISKRGIAVLTKRIKTDQVQLTKASKTARMYEFGSDALDIQPATSLPCNTIDLPSGCMNETPFHQLDGVDVYVRYMTIPSCIGAEIFSDYIVILYSDCIQKQDRNSREVLSKCLIENPHRLRALNERSMNVAVLCAFSGDIVIFSTEKVLERKYIIKGEKGFDNFCYLYTISNPTAFMPTPSYCFLASHSGMSPSSNDTVCIVKPCRYGLLGITRLQIREYEAEVQVLPDMYVRGISAMASLSLTTILFACTDGLKCYYFKTKGYYNFQIRPLWTVLRESRITDIRTLNAQYIFICVPFGNLIITLDQYGKVVDKILASQKVHRLSVRGNDMLITIFKPRVWASIACELLIT